MIDTLNKNVRKLPAWVICLIGGLYPFWLLWLALSGDLGVDPAKAMEHLLGERALQMLIAGLAITPLRNAFGINLIKFRRAIGVTAFYLVFSHLLVWLVLDVQLFDQIWADILKRPYITIGMAAFVIMIPLAVTSNNWSVRKLGRTWRKLHKLTYVICLLGGLHFVMLAKGFQWEPVLYLGTVIVLLLMRLKLAGFTFAWKRA
ncbi:protein-methionine-sulfoxide reductase heme-binding subunit MsrQ [Cognatishimia activa]|uniref:Protein-methionine-sulfoxide reductase heme-binding subunit MsrQ n=1 Tax=Cognatishimia activa TaxID=1715691 RepID=A0A0P1IL21_9RHOB|nr:protein-methionine-sulfoxide reductase heme-binding subunit MsrQ [Cognatishimia activa]CUI53297.1 Flavocytochrome YedZ [Cognatishimia activa]CUK24299.1 Flavocytochrome YedZ [Cognatishimia activa]